jgi:hypothetical protein
MGSVRVTVRNVIVSVLGIGFLCALPALADSTATPSSKAAIKVGDLNLLYGPQTAGSNAGPWETIMSTTIKTANGMDLIVCPSLECGLYTGTTVKSSNNTSDTSTATASLQVQVLIDGQPAQPGPVVYNARTQTLSATLQGIIGVSLTPGAAGQPPTINTTVLSTEQISLLLDTTSACSFNFAQTVGVGVHTIEVQARVYLGVAFQNGSATAQASMGKGSVTVETVRLVDKGTTIDF